MTTTTRSLRAAAVLLTGLIFLAGCSSGSAADEPSDAASIEASSSGSVVVAEAWSRQPAPGVTTAAVYARVTNESNIDRRVVGVSTGASPRAELHETVVDDDGFARMQQHEDGIVVPAGGELVFQPGGAHVMVFDINPEQFAGTFDVVFEFDDAQQVVVVVEVRPSVGATESD